MTDPTPEMIRRLRQGFRDIAAARKAAGVEPGEPLLYLFTPRRAAEHVDRLWRPGDSALVLFSDGVRRTADLSPGFIWVSIDSKHHLAAEGGFDADPIALGPTCDHCDRDLAPDATGYLYCRCDDVR